MDNTDLPDMTPGLFALALGSALGQGWAIFALNDEDIDRLVACDDPVWICDLIHKVADKDEANLWAVDARGRLAIEEWIEGIGTRGAADKTSWVVHFGESTMSWTKDTGCVEANIEACQSHFVFDFMSMLCLIGSACATTHNNVDNSEGENSVQS